MNKKELHTHPEERERQKKEEVYRKFYAIDVKPGDIVKYHASGNKPYFGLVVEVEEDTDQVFVKKFQGRIDWSIDRPCDRVWHSFNSRDWAVMNRKPINKILGDRDR